MAQCPCPSAGVGAQAAAAKAAAKLGESPSVAQTPPISPAGSFLPSLPPCQPRGCWLCPRVPAPPLTALSLRQEPVSCPGLAASRESHPVSASAWAVSQELEVRRCEASALGLGGGLLPLAHIPDSLPLSRQSEDRQRRQQRRRQRQRRELLVSSCCLGHGSAQGRGVHRCQGLCGSTAAPAAPILSSGYSPCPLSRPSSFSSSDEGLTGPSGCSSLA